MYPCRPGSHRLKGMERIGPVKTRFYMDPETREPHI